MVGSLTIIDLDNEATCPVLISAGVLTSATSGETRIVSGWGFSREEAHRRCRMEGIERAAALYRESIVTERFSYSDAVGEAIDPRQLVLLSAGQYSARPTWNRLHSKAHWLPAAFDPHRQIQWLVAQSFDNGRKVFVPAAHVLLGYPTALEDGLTVPDSSGVAAHHNKQKACAHALLELIERDAVAIWWYNKLEKPSMPLTTLPAEIGSFAQWVEGLGRRFWMLDLSTDLGIPVAAAITSTLAGEDLSFGFGAGWTPGEAALSAVGELAQFDATKRLRHSSGSDGPELVALAGRLTITQAKWLAPRDVWMRHDAGPRGIEELLVRLAQSNLEAFVVTLVQRQETAVRVVVPGLRPIWPRFAPGRLFDVPVLTGERQEPLSEAALNSDPILY